MDGNYSVSDKKNDKNRIEALAASAKSKDKYAFVELTGIFSPFIISLARSFNISESEFEDLCQEGRIALYKAVCNYNEDKSSFTTFARVCIKNAMTSFIRTYSVENKALIGNISLDDAEAENITPILDSTPEETLIATEFINELENAINTILSESERLVIKYKLSGIGSTEISVIVGKDTKSV
ncbi:MAG: sigma-70 family RNA polymerase sigma factor, partial [Clostridia bacterium]|nr:sigma-70 family RNA polymerase sigma factor [Clostridia bacterium]